MSLGMVLLSESAHSPDFSEVMRCWSSNLGFTPCALVKSWRFWMTSSKSFFAPVSLVEKPVLQTLLLFYLNQILLFAYRIALSQIIQPHLLLQTTNACSPMLLLLVIFTLLPERIALYRLIWIFM